MLNPFLLAFKSRLLWCTIDMSLTDGGKAVEWNDGFPLGDPVFALVEGDLFLKG